MKIYIVKYSTFHINQTGLKYFVIIFYDVHVIHHIVIVLEMNKLYV